MAKITVSSATLQKMLNKVMKGVINNNFVAITSFVEIKLADGEFSLMASNDFNKIKIKEKIEGSNFCVVVSADKFNKLIQKVSSANVTLELKEKWLEITAGTGVYKLELPTMEDDTLVKMPKMPVLKGEKSTLNLTKLLNVIETNKAALAVDLEQICYTGYYCGKRSVTFNETLIAINAIELFDPAFLAGQDLFLLLTTMNPKEEITVYRDNDKILFDSDSVTIYSLELQGKNLFQYDTLVGHSNTEFKHACRVNKKEFINILDRLSLFMEAEDDNVIQLTVSNKSILLGSKKSTGTEELAFIYKPSKESQEPVAFTTPINLPALKAVLTSLKTDDVLFHYGPDNAVKLTESDYKDGEGKLIKAARLAYLIALPSEDEVSVEEIVEEIIEETEEEISEDENNEEEYVDDEEMPF